MNEWWLDATCKGINQAWVFPEEQLPKETPEDYAIYVESHAAEMVHEFCSICPVRTECLDYALVTNSRYGVFGGLSHLARKGMKRENQ